MPGLGLKLRLIGGVFSPMPLGAVAHCRIQFCGLLNGGRAQHSRQTFRRPPGVYTCRKLRTVSPSTCKGRAQPSHLIRLDSGICLALDFIRKGFFAQQVLSSLRLPRFPPAAFGRHYRRGRAAGARPFLASGTSRRLRRKGLLSVR